jgi:hypothetical protein
VWIGLKISILAPLLMVLFEVSITVGDYRAFNSFFVFVFVIIFLSSLLFFVLVNV